MNRFFQVFLLVLFVITLKFEGVAQAQESRVFTNTSGVKIEAALLEIVDKKQVRIKRTSDGREFLLDIQTLSLEDQQYLASQLGMGARSETKKGTLIVEMPHPRDSVSILTERTSLVNATIGASKTRLPIPVDSWVIYDPEEISGYILIPYFGAASWKIEIDEDRCVWLSRDGGDKELVGYSFSSLGTTVRFFEDELEELDLTKVKHSLSVGYYSDYHLEALEKLPSDLPLALAPTSTLDDADEIRPLRRMNLRALHCTIDDSVLSELNSLDPLEMLVLNVRELSLSRELDLPELEKLKHLVLLDNGEQVQWDEALAGYPELRSLVIASYSGEDGEGGSPITTFAANPNLNFLAINDTRHQIVENDAVATASNLEFLRLLSGSSADTGGEYPGITTLKNLKSLYFSDRQVPESLFDEWFESGLLAGLTDFGGYYVPEFKYAPKLEAISIFQSESSGLFPKYERFSEAPPTLMKIFASSLTRKDFEFIAPPHNENIISLQLSSCSVDDPEMLYRFSNLERISLTRNSGRISNLDLARFGNLTYLYLSSFEELDSLSGISSHPKLEEASIYSCRYLENLGDPAPNSSLLTLYLSNNPRLANLDSLGGLRGLNFLNIYKCDGLENFDVLEENNDIIYLSVRDCEKMADVNRYPRR